MLKQLWNDETGALLSAELVLLGTLLLIGTVAGLATLRDGLVTELADLAAGVAILDQSYTVSGITGPGTSTAGTKFLDESDPGDTGETSKALFAERCIVICESTGSEGTI